MAGEGELNTIESGISPEPQYDKSTHQVVEIEDGQWKARDPHPHESVRAAVQEQRAKNDPLEPYKARLKANGRTEEQFYREVDEIEQVFTKDPVAGLGRLCDRFGYDRRQVAEHLYNGTTPNGNATAAEQEAIARAIQRFDAQYSDPITKSLRPAAQKILAAMPDSGLRKFGSYDQALDYAFGKAWHDMPANKLRRAPAQILEERDRQRNEGLANRVQKRWPRSNGLDAGRGRTGRTRTPSRPSGRSRSGIG
jgi:hypothetical protein